LAVVDGGHSHVSSNAIQPQFVADAFPQPKGKSSESANSKIKNIAYDDMYPNGDKKKPDYDEVPDSEPHNGESTTSEDTKNGETKLHDGEMHNDSSDPSFSSQSDSTPEKQNVEEIAPEETVQEEKEVTEEPYEEPTTRRRILYVTKRPRLGIVQN
jgi:hypothetical protein